MTKHRSPRAKFKQNGQAVPKGSRWSSRRKTDGTFYVLENGTVGFGKTNGEQSYNNRPVRTDWVDRIRKTGARQTWSGPFDAPGPKN